MACQAYYLILLADFITNSTFYDSTGEDAHF